MSFEVKIPGACGELVQGRIDNQPFLVTCPINLYTTAEVVDTITYLPYKAKLARQRTLEYLNRRSWTKFALHSQLLKSKGLASSSADIAAIAQLTALSCGKRLRDWEVAKIAASIEPTDGIFCQGIVNFNHLTGKILERLGPAPKVTLLMFDCGGRVNTLLFNRRKDLVKLYRENETEIKTALELLRQGLKTDSLKLIGQATSLSAYANQRILYKPELEQVMIISEQYDAAGVNVAHSGTIIGVLFKPQTPTETLRSCTEHILRECYHLKFLQQVELISGGMFIKE